VYPHQQVSNLGTGFQFTCTAASIKLVSAYRYDAAIVEEVKQGLLSHTVGMNAGTGERVVTFDQWVQLFHWIGSRLDIHDTDKLHQRMGAHFGVKELDEFRAPLQVRIFMSGHPLHTQAARMTSIPTLDSSCEVWRWFAGSLVKDWIHGFHGLQWKCFPGGEPNGE
jgi:hypothetical protein